MPTSTAPTVIVLIPVLNDWEALLMLLQELDTVVHEQSTGYQLSVLLVDDGSTDPIPAQLQQFQPRELVGIDVLVLRRNLGHQRAIAIGLSYIESHIHCEAVLVMDGDGEDAPRDVPRLLQALDEHGGRKVIFAERMRRSEGYLFRCFYWLYRQLHLLLTGIPVRVGNFSVCPAPLLKRLVVVSDLWNHYAASIFKSRVPHESIPTQRGRRYAGQTRMNFLSLVIHGLSAISVFSDRVGVRLLTTTSILVAGTFVALLSAVGLRLIDQGLVPGWTTYIVGILLVVLLQMLMMAIVFVFIVLSGRDSSQFLPTRDHVYFVDSLTTLYGNRRTV